MPTESNAPFNWVPPLLVFAAVLVGGLLLRALAFRALGRWARSTVTRADDIVLAAIRWPSVVWIFLLAIIAALHVIDLPGAQFDNVIRRTMDALLVLSITLGVARLVRELVSGGYHPAGADARIVPSGLLTTFATLATLCVGLLVMLGTLGINIVPLLGALGVGGLAAGLALQPTLSNLFAGFQIAASRQLRIGHRIRLASGEEGHIVDIAWRTTTLRTPADHLIVIPNSRLADTIVTNYNLPGAEVNITVAIGVAYASDPRRVEAALRDEAERLAKELPQLVDDVAPVVRLQSFGESALNYNVILRVRDFDLQFEAWNTVYVRFFERLRKEGIEIAFPSRNLYLRGDWPAVPRAQGEGAAPADDGAPAGGGGADKRARDAKSAPPT